MDKAIKMARMMLGNKTSVTKGEIEESVDQVLHIPKFKQLERQQLIRELESLYAIRINEFRIIEDVERRMPWLSDRRAEIQWDFWKRYRSYLQENKNIDNNTVNELHRLSDKILDSLFNPEEDIVIDKKGLVVGQVQSGKTQNYTGLICKAADAGFGLIIVLSGIHESLRCQTQLRIDEGFLGFDTQYARASSQSSTRIGVGTIDSSKIAHSLTSSLEKGDFSTAAANSSGINFSTKEPIVAIVKKNTHILKVLHEWLSAQASCVDDERKITKKSLLLIDDEADHASINTSKDEHKPTRINERIRNILLLFGKSAYVGYTATPFANLFISQKDNDIFPRDFIINIDAPSNYIGPEKVFGFRLDEEDDDNDKLTGDVLPIIRRIEDYLDFVPEKHHKNDPLPTKIPESLKEAIRCFIITCAVRRLRGQTKVHNSMLIHVSRFQLWQGHIVGLVRDQFEEYRRAIELNDEETIEIFRKTFEEDRVGYRSYFTTTKSILKSSLGSIDPSIKEHSWNEVRDMLYQAAAKIEVMEIHGGSKDVLSYYDHKNGLSVIVVGGNKLSRGLTLEGLSISYYSRKSRMYDTLMQMARWFGYRKGYVDLCRLFTSREMNEYFCHITHASEELRKEFKYMTEKAGSTPDKYALKVRTHPGILQISATNKLRHAETVRLSWAGRLVESYEFSKSYEVINNNYSNLEKLLKTLPGKHEIINGKYLWYDVKSEVVISFLRGIITPEEKWRDYAPNNITKYIKAQEKNQELISWRVALMSKSKAGSNKILKTEGDSINVGCVIRTQDPNNSNEELFYLKKSHIISRGDESIDLLDEENEYKKSIATESGSKENENEKGHLSGVIVRNNLRDPKNPLLLIYLIDPASVEKPADPFPFVGYAVSFPWSRHNECVNYAIHKDNIKHMNLEHEEEPEDED